MTEILTKKGLNAVLTDANIFDCGNKLGFLYANLVMGIRGSKLKEKFVLLCLN